MNQETCSGCGIVKPEEEMIYDAANDEYYCTQLCMMDSHNGVTRE